MTPAESIAALGASLFGRRLTFGRTGNISVRSDDGMTVTPTGTSLGALDPAALSTVGLDGVHRGGPPPSKEWYLHAAVYRARPDAAAVVHLHSTYAVAVSCLSDVDAADALPRLTAYYALRVGRLPVLPYHRPGDPALGPVAEAAAADHHAFLLANHGSVAAGPGLAEAADVAEEIEETARLFLLLRGSAVRPVP
jgi:3-dehydro-4-phosphotetronate decarboxylase